MTVKPGPTLGSLVLGATAAAALGSSFLLVFQAQPFPSPLSFRGMGALVFVGWWFGPAPGFWLPGLGELGGEVQRDLRGQRAGV